MKLKKIPDPPDRFWGRQLTYWKEFCTLLLAENILDNRDFMTLVSLIDLWAEYDRSQEIIKEDGLFYDSGKMKRPHPALDTINRCRRDLVIYIDHFGLSPKARSKMENVFKSGEPKTKLDKMLSK